MITFDDLLKNRRSIRHFKETPVPTDTITSIIQDSTMAPSSGNEQSWQFIIVKDRSIMKDISQDCKNSILSRISRNPDDYAKKYETLLSKNEYNIFYNAPSLVFIMGTKRIKNSEINCCLAASYFMFSAIKHGLGTCWISFGKFICDDTIKQKLGITHDHFIVAPIILGYPEKIPPMPPRKPADIIKII